MKTFISSFRLTFLWALFILVICDINLGLVGHSHLFFVGFDKIVHCGLFFVFVVFLCSELMRQQNTRLLSYKYLALAGIAGILFGGTIELLQLFIFTWRSGEWNDLFADTIGISMAIFSVWKVNRAVSYEKN